MFILVHVYLNLLHDVASGSDITTCINIDKPLVVYMCSNIVQAFRFMVSPAHCSMISKYGPSLSKAVGPVDPSFLVVKKSHFNKNILLQRVYELQNTESTCRLSIQ